MSEILRHQFDNGTADADPGSGKLRLNNADQSAASFIYASKTDFFGSDCSASLLVIDDSSSSIRALLVLINRDDPGKRLIFNVTGAVTSAIGYVKIPIAIINELGGADPLSDDDNLDFSWARTGDVGAATGPQGDPGSQILTGAVPPDDDDGVDGDLYINTANGDLYQKASSTWGSALANLTGPIGETGDTGNTGGDGAQGEQGNPGPAAHALVFVFSSSTTVADPGDGQIRLNNADQELADRLVIDDSDDNGNDVQQWLRQFNAIAGTSSRGIIWLQKEGSPHVGLIFQVDNQVEQDGFFETAITSLAEMGPDNPLEDGDRVLLSFTQGAVIAEDFEDRIEVLERQEWVYVTLRDDSSPAEAIPAYNITSADAGTSFNVYAGYSGFGGFYMPLAATFGTGRVSFVKIDDTSNTIQVFFATADKCLDFEYLTILVKGDSLVFECDGTRWTLVGRDQIIANLFSAHRTPISSTLPSATYNMGKTDRNAFLRFTADTEAGILNLLNSSNNGYVQNVTNGYRNHMTVFIALTWTSNFSLTINATDSELICGEPSLVLNEPGELVILGHDSAEWFIMARYVPSVLFDAISSVMDSDTIDLEVTDHELTAEVKADSIGDTHIDSGDPIVYANLDLTNGIVDNDISQAAQIGEHKLQLSDRFDYLFDTSTSMTDPGSANLRVDNATLSAVASIAISDTDFGVQSRDTVLDNIGSNHYITLRLLSDQSRFARYRVTAMTDNGAWHQFGVTFVSSSGALFSNAAQLGLHVGTTILNADIDAAAAIAYSKLALTDEIVNADIDAAAAIAYGKLNLGASIVEADISQAAAIKEHKLSLSDRFDYLFDTSTVMADPGASNLRLDNAAMSSVTSLAVSDTDFGLQSRDTVLDAISSVMYITLRLLSDQSRYARYKVTSVTDNGDWHQFGVTYIGSSGALFSASAQLGLHVGFEIVNGDIAAAAAIAYSKLDLGASIVNGDVNSTAAIDRSKVFGSPRNYLVNGNFRHWQHGTSFTGATTYLNNDDSYTADQWILLSDGNDIADISRESTVVPDGARFAMLLDVETGNKQFGIFQPIERDETRLLRGQNISLAFEARITGTSISALKARVVEWTGTADSITSDIVSAWNGAGVDPTLVASWAYLAPNASTNPALTTSFQTYKFEQSPVGSSANNLGVFIWVDDDTLTVADFLYITNVRLTLGNQALPYEIQSPSDEHSRVLRFFRSSFLAGTAPADGLGTNGALIGKGISSALFDLEPTVNVRFEPPMRSTPTITRYNPLSGGTAGEWQLGAGSSANARTFWAFAEGIVIDNTGTQLSNAAQAFIHYKADARL